MTPKLFIQRFMPVAQQIEQDWGIPAIVTLTQSAAESGWGTKAPGYNFFGYTAPDNYSGQKQLLKTVEKHSTPNVWYPSIIRIAYNKADGLYHYLIRRYFKAYNSAGECFEDYARLLSSDRYKGAFDYSNDPERFLAVVVNSGYNPNPTQYYQFAITVMQSIKKRL